MEPKVPDDIYKTHLTEVKTTTIQKTESARLNLASTFVNAFVNVGFGKDKLMIVAESTSLSVHCLFLLLFDFLRFFSIIRLLVFVSLYFFCLFFSLFFFFFLVSLSVSI
jgi:hypothetical protein